MSIHIDASEFRTFTSDMFRGMDQIPSEAHRVVERAAVNMKNDLVGEASRSRHFRIDRHINYDMRAGYHTSEAEVGPDKAGAGNLANIAYFGGANGGGGTLPDPEGALTREIPNLERYLGEVLEGLF